MYTIYIYFLFQLLFSFLFFCCFCFIWMESWSILVGLLTSFIQSTIVSMSQCSSTYTGLSSERMSLSGLYGHHDEVFFFSHGNVNMSSAAFNDDEQNMRIALCITSTVHKHDVYIYVYRLIPCATVDLHKCDMLMLA